MAINKVSEITKTRIKEQSVLSLPDKPSEKGYGAQQLKEFFTNIVVGDIGALAEIDRVVVELNRYLDGLENTSIKNYVIDSIISKFVEQGPFTSLKFEENKLKYTKFGNPTISGEIDIIPDNSVFFNSETLQNKDGAIIYPKTTLDNIVDKMDDKSVKEFLLNLKTKINEIESNHEIDIKTIEDNLNAILGGDAPAALDSIKELAEALKNNPSSIDDILQQLSNLNTNKVDKVNGKGLSTNDYDNNTKAFVEELRNKDVALKTDIKTSLSQMQQDSNFRTVRDADIDYWNSKAENVHYHEIKHISGLQQKLDMKSDTNHTHTLSNIGIDIAGISEQYVSTHNKSSSSHQDIRDEIKEVKNKVDGINNALSFENVSQLTAWFGGTYNRADGKKPSDLYVGQHIYLKDQDEDDYWVSVVPANMSNLSILETDKIDLAEYPQKNELKRVAFTGSYTDLENKPSIPTTLADLSSDAEHAHITQEQVEQIETNKNNIANKLDKALGSSEANKMIVTDSEGNVVTAEAGSMAVMVDNLESTSTDMALAANQGRVLDNKKLDKQQGVDNAGKVLVVNDNGVVTPASGYATETFVQQAIEELSEKNVFILEEAVATLTLFNNNDLAEGIYILKNGGDLYYGHKNYQTNTNYSINLKQGSVVVIRRITEWSGSSGETHFKAISVDGIYTGYTTYSNGVKRVLPIPTPMKSGTYTTNYVLKITNTSNNNAIAEWVAPDTIGNGVLTLQQEGTQIGTFSANQGSSKTINIDTSSKLDKVTSTGGWKVYAVDEDGNQDILPVAMTETTTNNGAIPTYMDSTTGTISPAGSLVTNEPTNDYHAANKKYVDQKIADVPTGITKLEQTSIVLNQLEPGAYYFVNPATLSLSSGAKSVSVGAGSTIVTARYYDDGISGYCSNGEINATYDGTTLPVQYKFYDGSGSRYDRIDIVYNYASGHISSVSLTTSGNINCVNLTASGYIDATSDIRLKENICCVDEETIKSMVENTPIKAFNYIRNGNRTIGLMAQDIESVDINGAEFVDKDEDGFLKVRESKFVYILWNYCQQLNKRIQELEKRMK